MNDQLISLLVSSTGETLYMTVISTFVAYVIGIPLGVLLYVTSKEGTRPNFAINFIVGLIVNVLRSVPFLILLVAILPFTRIVAGTTLGTQATVVPLIVAAAPYVARMVESSLKEVNTGVVEAAQSMGTSTFQIITKVYLPEARPSLLVGAAISLATILGYSAMAGFVGGGGLGAVAINYGYYRYQTDIMLITVLLLVVIVQIFQEGGLALARRTDKRLK
ncbi:MAG: methionine ABC transporter permease [Phoenicibacter congonensis]|uniref:Methionine ABC transporter permease n=1 Tax=Phoenicibacter congonensis TaxID=1944646 RepID=A0AA43UB48_9ACTN|nr:methionine ABC transporter permease [Phoenicibacter congonensis]